MRGTWRFISTVIGIIFRHPITGTTIIPVLPDGRIVLVQRRDNKKWGLPGGIIDWGEDIPHAAKRELKEETGLDVVKLGRLVGVYSSPDRDPRIHSISLVLEAQVAGDLVVEDELEILQVKAFHPEDLPRGNLCHDHDHHLNDYFDGSTTVT